jgi:hypothetical protein
MPDESRMRSYEPPKRRVDCIEIDIGDETINAGIDTTRLRSEYEAVLADQACDRFQVRDSAPIDVGRLVPPEALIMLALEIVPASRLHPACGQTWMSGEHRIAEQWPKLRVLPARIGHNPVEIIERATDH